MISYLLTPLDFVIHLVDAWIEDRVKKIIKKTAHLDNLTLIGFNIFTLLNLALCWASVIQLMFP